MPESSFVAAARDEIPGTRTRVTTSSSRGNLRTARSRGRGRGGNNSDAAQTGTANDTTAQTANATSTARGTGRGRRSSKRSAEASTSTTHDVPNNGRSNTRRRATYNTGSGSAHYLLFGDENVGQQQNPVPDLNATVLPDLNEEEIQVTQNAPGE